MKFRTSVGAYGNGRGRRPRRRFENKTISASKGPRDRNEYGPWGRAASLLTGTRSAMGPHLSRPNDEGEGLMRIGPGWESGDGKCSRDVFASFSRE
ncbi:hypothetical protein GWI33_014629 [Rhynchophorus ferrugineus]|uniref:Uncharacterized protein n=1 Tax=Rhynchophorus ferrugineus TaxID=354439 RepID=A0A834I4U4_RHYFE|nr:hypothetical protein GWI33_014629 [Rhynchophorus ferrugineus]